MIHSGHAVANMWRKPPNFSIRCDVGMTSVAGVVLVDDSINEMR